MSKKKKRREKRRMTPAAPLVRRGWGPTMPKLSDQLVELAQPVFDEIGYEDDPLFIRAVLAFAGLAWNCGLSRDPVPVDAIVLAARTLELPLAKARALIEQLCLRRRVFFADDRRVILDVMTFEEDSEIRVEVLGGM